MSTDRRDRSRQSSTELAHRHLWMHFSAPRRVRRRHAGADHRARRGLLRVGRARQAATSTGCRGCSPCRSATAAPTSPRPRRTPGRDARVLPDLDLRAPAGDRARGPARRARARRPQPRVLHQRRLRGGGVGVEARPPVLPRHRPGPALQGDRARAPRTTAPRSGRSRSPASPRCATPFEPLTPGRVARRQHQPLPPPARRRREGVHARGHRRDRGARSSSRGPRRSPRCSSSRCRTPAAASCRPTGYFQRVREICDRYGVLLVSDEVICAFGRLGDDVRLRALRLPARHDHLRQGPHERVLAARRGDLSRLPRRAVPRAPARRSLHGITFGGHPVSCAVGARQPRRLRARRTCSSNVRAHEAGFRERLEGLRDLPIVGDVRGAGLLPGARARAATRRPTARVHRASSARSCSAASSRPGSTTPA